MTTKQEGYSVFKRNDGTYVLGFQPEHGAAWKQKRLGYHDDDAAANRAALKWLAQQRADGTLPAATRTIADCAKLWIPMRKANPELSGATVRDNEDQLKNHILPRFGSVPIGKLDTKMLRDFVRLLREKVSASRCRNVVNTMSALYEDARAEGWVKTTENVVRHPMVKREVPSAGNESEETIVLSLEAAQALIGSAGNEQRRIRYMIAFLTGLRDGEIAGLTWGDVDLDAEPPRVRIRRAQALRAKRGTHAVATDPKTRQSKRIIPLHAGLAQALRWWRDERWEAWAGAQLTPDAPLLPSPRTGKAWRPKSAEDIREDLAALGLPTETEDGASYDFHATRRSFNTWLVEAGVDETTRKQLMGHGASSTGEKHYTGVLLARMHTAVSCIPLRWGLASLSDFVSVPVPFGVASDAHYAHLVQAHNEGDETASSHLSSAVEQRFRKSLGRVLETVEAAEEDAGESVDGPPRNGPRARTAKRKRLAGKKRSGYDAHERWRRKQTAKACEAIVECVDLVIDGRTTLSASERERHVVALLAKATERLDKRDGVKHSRVRTTPPGGPRS